MTEYNCTDLLGHGEDILSSLGLDLGAGFNQTAAITPSCDFNSAATPAAQDMLCFIQELSQNI